MYEINIVQYIVAYMLVNRRRLMLCFVQYKKEGRGANALYARLYVLCHAYNISYRYKSVK